jgi:hypothetical protein
VLAGNLSIGRGAVIGAGAIVLPEVTIGDDAVVTRAVSCATPFHRTVLLPAILAASPRPASKYKGFSI